MIQEIPKQIHRAKRERNAEGALAKLISNLEVAVGNGSPMATAIAVKKALEDSLRNDRNFIPERFLQPAPDRYARRLIYMGIDRRFSLLAMVWKSGQGTPIHDHGGDWCVECIYRGAMRSTIFDALGESDGVHRFAQREVIEDREGQASALVPPLDHHILENVSGETTVTLHVYAHELTQCNAFLPCEGGHTKKVCQLGYTD